MNEEKWGILGYFQSHGHVAVWICCGMKFWLLPSPEVIKKKSCPTQLSTKFILLINVKMPTIVGILTFISMINTTS